MKCSSRKVSPLTDKQTKSPMVVPAIRRTETICHNSSTETTNINSTCTTVYYVFFGRFALYICTNIVKPCNKGKRRNKKSHPQKLRWEINKLFSGLIFWQRFSYQMNFFIYGMPDAWKISTVKIVCVDLCLTGQKQKERDEVSRRPGFWPTYDRIKKMTPYADEQALRRL